MPKVRTHIFAFIALGVVLASAPFLPASAQDGQRSPALLRPTQITGLRAVQVKRTVVEDKAGIEVTFDKPSAERVLSFTTDAVGRRIAFFVNQRKLATLRLLDPIKEGNILLTGVLDSVASEALFSAGAVIDIAFE